jgi:hypothetical protein
MTPKLDSFTRGYITAALWSSTANVYYCPTCKVHLKESDVAGPTEDIPAQWCPECETDVIESDASFERAGFDTDDLAPETLARMIADCEAFQRQNCLTLPVYEREREHGEWTGSELAGHDFWLTRCGHGTGFWDRFNDAPFDKIGDKLTKSAKRFDNVDLYLGDDGRIYA